MSRRRAFWSLTGLALGLALLFFGGEAYAYLAVSTSSESHELGEMTKNRIFVRFFSIFVCFLSSVLGLFLQSERFEKGNPVASVLAGILVRTTIVLGALAISSATKWTAHNLFGTTLVGCYFSFLALESWLAIRRISTRRQL